MLIVYIAYVRYELSPNYVPLSPLPLKVGGHVPQLLWERRPWMSARSVYTVQGLLTKLALRLRLAVYNPGDYVCRQGDVGREMYIIGRGRLIVVGDSGHRVFATLSDGNYFGEVQHRPHLLQLPSHTTRLSDSITSLHECSTKTNIIRHRKLSSYRYNCITCCVLLACVLSRRY